MTNIIKAKYIDLMVDWSFKRVFGTEVNRNKGKKRLPKRKKVRIRGTSVWTGSFSLAFWTSSMNRMR